MFDPKPGERPQQWDTHKAAKAFADAQQVVAALLDGKDNAMYLTALEEVAGRALDSRSDVEFRDRLAYFIYGLALFGAASLSLAESAGGLTREEALGRVGQGLDALLG